MQPSSWQQIRKRSHDEERYKLLSIEVANINEKACNIHYHYHLRWITNVRKTDLFNQSYGIRGAVIVFCRNDRVYMHGGKEQLITILECLPKVLTTSCGNTKYNSMID